MLPTFPRTITPATGAARLFHFSEVYMFGLLRSSIWRRYI